MTILLRFVLYTVLCMRRGPIYVVVVSSWRGHRDMIQSVVLIERVKFYIT